MNSDIRQGMFFGVNTGVITTAGIISGVSQSTKNPLILIVTLISLALSDGISESYSLYISKKAKNINDNTNGPLYSSISSIISKILVNVSFLIPLLFNYNLYYFKNLLWPLTWSISIIILIDYNISKLRDEKFIDYFIPHILILLAVLGLTKYIGVFIS